jgi:hypothetical protein
MSRIRILAEVVANKIAAGDSKCCAKEDFSLGGAPGKYRNLASGAKAQLVGASTQGLKPLPPKETAGTKKGGA